MEQAARPHTPSSAPISHRTRNAVRRIVDPPAAAHCAKQRQLRLNLRGLVANLPGLALEQRDTRLVDVETADVPHLVLARHLVQHRFAFADLVAARVQQPA